MTLYLSFFVDLAMLSGIRGTLDRQGWQDYRVVVNLNWRVRGQGEKRGLWSVGNVGNALISRTIIITLRTCFW